jgi:hypothetical protein
MSCEVYIFFMKREGASEGLAVVKGKNGEDHEVSAF